MMAYCGELKPDASRCFGAVIVSEVNQDSSYADLLKLLDRFFLSDLKIMFFLCMTDLYSKESLMSYLQLVAKEENYLKFQFSKKWVEEKYNRRDLIELLGTMKKFKHLKELGINKQIFKDQARLYKNIPEMCKFFFSICEELDDDEVKNLTSTMFPDVSEDISGEEFICLMLLHEKISCDDFGQLKDLLATLNRDDLKSQIETYEVQNRLHISSMEFYKIRQPYVDEPSGLALIINQTTFTESECDAAERLFLEERTGSDIDCSNLEKLWHTFGFKVELHANLTEEKILKLLQSLFHRDLTTYDVFVMCILSHGKKGCFYTTDSKMINIESVINEIADNCMVGKPKLFFVQACQGDHHNQGVPVHHQQSNIRRNLVTDSRSEMGVIPRGSDVFKALATIDDYVSYRDVHAGSLFISYLVENVNKYGEREDIQAVLTRVKKDISEQNAVFNNQMYKQQPVSTSTLRAKVVLKRVLM